MISEKNIKHVFLSGIGGTGMAALANLFVEKGYEVSGSDSQYYPPMGDFLERLPIQLYEGFSENNIRTAEPDMVIIGNALSRGNVEVEFVLNQKIPFISMAGALKHFFMFDKKNIVVTGTHGKTTTTSILAHLFNNSSIKSSFLVGGIPLNFKAPSQYNNGAYFIIEGDEYDSAFFEKIPKFLQYEPHILIINNIEFDHADIYNSLEEIKKQFKYLLRFVPGNGLIIANGDDVNVREVCEYAFSPVIYYGKNENNEYNFLLQESENKYSLDIFNKGSKEITIPLDFSLEGMAYNMLASYIAAKSATISLDEIENGFSKFKGVKRRLEIIFNNKGYIVFDDFAHHPTAVSITVNALKQKYPQNPVVAIFEPRSNTSIRNIFVSEYKEAFLAADHIFLAPAFKKRVVKSNDELKVNEITDYLISKGKNAETAKGHEELLEKCKKSLPENSVIILMSNGNFEPFKSSLLEYLKFC